MKELHNWSQQGKIYIWEYYKNRKNFPGVHFTFDNKGKFSFVALCHLLIDAPEDSYRTIALTAPQSEQLVIVNNGATFDSKKSAKIGVCSNRNSIVGKEERYYFFNFTREELRLVHDFLIDNSDTREWKLGKGSDSINFW